MLSRAPAPADSAPTPVSQVEAKGLAPLDREEGVPTVSAPTPVRLVEAKVFAQLDWEEGDQDAGLWYLNTGATNHMTGARGVFSELDTSVAGTVLFGDGSMVEIEGRGMIPVIRKNGCRSTLTGVYFIPRLTTNILSVGQLDKVGCRVAIEKGVLRIWNHKKELVVTIQRTANRLDKF